MSKEEAPNDHMWNNWNSKMKSNNDGLVKSALINPS